MRGRVNRRRRSWGFDGNDLRRDVDRLQWRLGLLSLMLFLSVTPPLCANVVQGVYVSGVRTEHHQVATRHRVEATVVRVRDLGSRQEVTVSWTAAEGTRHTNEYTTWRGAEVGERLILWASPEGVSLAPPRRRTQTVIRTIAAGAGVTFATGLPLLGLYWLARRRCDRYRYRLWDAEWVHLDDHRIGP